MFPLVFLLSSSRNFKEICIMHLPRRPNKYFNSCYILQHLQAAFFIVADWHLPALPAVSLLHLCLGPCPVPPRLLSHLSWSTLCWHDGSSSGCLAPFSIDFPLVSYYFFDILFMWFFLFFQCAASNGFVLICVHLRCDGELSAQLVCLCIEV